VFVFRFFLRPLLECCLGLLPGLLDLFWRIWQFLWLVLVVILALDVAHLLHQSHQLRFAFSFYVKQLTFVEHLILLAQQQLLIIILPNWLGLMDVNINDAS